MNTRTNGPILRGLALSLAPAVFVTAMTLTVQAGEAPQTRTYENRLTRLSHPQPILADHPDFVEPVIEVNRFEAPRLVEDQGGDLDVRAWRFSYNARGIIEMPNRLDGKHTALVVVHPWGIDDGGGWKSPEPAGVALCCTPEKNAIYNRHVREVLNPFIQRMRQHVALVAYSLPGTEDPIRGQLYRSVRRQPTPIEQIEGARALEQRLNSFRYEGSPVDPQLSLDNMLTVATYFKQFPGIDSSAKFNREGFWNLPIPVVAGIQRRPDDVVIYDAEGYPLMRDFLRAQGIRHVLLCGYNTDMCVCKTTAGYENLAPDFNVFLVGDATIATFPAATSPRFATNAALCFASLRQLISQVSWIQPASE